MPIAHYSPKELGLPPKIALQTDVGEIYLQEGENSLSDDKAKKLAEIKDGENLAPLGKAIEISGLGAASPPTKPTPPAEHPKQETIDIPDIESMSAEDAIAAIKAISDRDLLQLLLEAEQTSKKRKTVMNQLQEALKANAS